MCGIAGCIAPAGEEPPRAALEAMAKALDHRGPDDRGIEVSGQVGLVQTRLAIVDPGPSGRQPMVDPSSRWMLTYSGEIFNHLELRDRLPDVAYRGHSDTETLLVALREWGEDAIRRLNGQFAFAAADLAENRVLLARDHFGIKPLYVARHDGCVWFASEIGALLGIGVPRRPRTNLVAHSIVNAWPTGQATLIEGIDRVAPGGLVSIDVETLETAERRWYDPVDAVDAERAAELEGRSREELTDLLEDTLRTAVGRQLMADVPVGTSCSGGIDSGLVTAFAHEERPEMVAYTISLAQDPADETPSAKRVVRHLDIPLNCAELNADAWRGALVPAVLHHEYPLHPVAVPIAPLAASARANGAKVLLTGEAGDELFGGYPGEHVAHYRQALPLRSRARRASDAVRGVGLRRLQRSAARILARQLRSRDEASNRDDPFGPADDSVRRDQALDKRSVEAYGHHPGPTGRLEAALLASLVRRPLPMLLNRMDKNALQSSIEARVPYLDPDLVSLVLNLPVKHRVGPRPKGILRDLARRMLPVSIARRPKRNGLWPDTRRLVRSAGRVEFWENGHLRDLLGVPEPAWRNRIAALKSDEELRLCSAEIWCRLFLDGQSAERVENELWVG